jgi:multidrug efflux pump subunit AcrA (membrane-fusion protein)
LIWVALVAFSLIAISIWRLQGNAEAQASPTLATATRGPIVVTVGGVGRIVEARLSGQSGITGAASSSSTTTGGSATAQANAVFSRATGTISQVLVAPGQRVAAGQVLALVDDGGAVAAATRQAEIDVETALVELPPSARAGTIDLAERSITLAKQRLALTRGPADPADLSAARAEVEKARADLAALRKPAPAASAEAVTAARTAVTLAEQRLAKLTGPPDPVALATAGAELRKAEADLEALVRTDRTQPVTKKEIDAAKAAIEAARLRLERLQAPPDVTDVSAAQLELDRARADIAALLRPPPAATKEAIAAAELALVAAKEKRKKIRRGFPKADVTAAKLEVQRARLDLRTLKATIRGSSSGRIGGSADVSVRLGLLKIRSAQGRLDAARAAEDMLVVRAPWGGTASGVFIAPGAHVDPTTPIAAISDLDNLAVNVDLSEFDVAQVEPGMKAIVSVDALGGEPYGGKVVLVAFTGTDNGGIVTFPVRVGLADSEGLKPGMNTSVRIIVAQKKSVVRVPLEAVTQDEEDRSFVTVLDESGQEVERPVQIGLETTKQVEIVKGLSAGARVVLPEVQDAAQEEE